MEKAGWKYSRAGRDATARGHERKYSFLDVDFICALTRRLREHHGQLNLVNHSGRRYESEDDLMRCYGNERRETCSRAAKQLPWCAPLCTLLGRAIVV